MEISQLKKLQAGKYNLTISYETRTESIELKNKSLDMDTVLLYPQRIEFNEIVIETDPLPASVKKDTTEYNAGAFKTHSGATAEDLVKKCRVLLLRKEKLKHKEKK